jgi:hypothetical protein
MHAKNHLMEVSPMATRKSKSILVKEIIDRLEEIFWGRRGPIPIQKPDGSYYPGSSWNKELWEDHLVGNATYGLYPITSQSTSKIMALDIDDHSGEYPQGFLLNKIKELVHVIMQFDISREHILVENSGRGYHVWMACEETMKTWRLYNCITVLQEEFNRTSNDLKINEFWPSHPGLEAGIKYGNLIRLPLGKHQKTGHESKILDWNFQECTTLLQLHSVLHTFRFLNDSNVLPISNSKPYNGPFNPFGDMWKFRQTRLSDL